MFVLAGCTLKVQVTSTLPPLDKISPSSPKIDIAVESFPKIHYGSTSTPEMSWVDAKDDDGGSGVSHYELSVGTAGNLNDVVNWTDVGSVNHASLTVPKLNRGQQYYLSLIAVDHAGNRSEPVTSPPWQMEPLVVEYENVVHGLGLNGFVYQHLVTPQKEEFLAYGFSKYGVNYVGCEGKLTSTGQIDVSFYSSNSIKFCRGQLKTAVYQRIGSVDYSLLIGDMSLVNGVYSGTQLYRTKYNGELDTTFQANLGTGFAAGTLKAIAVTADNKILVGGTFTSFNGVAVGRMIRLNTDGTLDTSFNIGVGFDGAVNSIAVTPGGQIVVGGTFNKLNNVTISRYITLLNSSGSVDATFATNAGLGFDAYDAAANVSHVGMTSSGQIITSGRYTSYNGSSMTCTSVLNLSGTVDATYRTNIATKFSCSNIGKVIETTDAFVYTGYLDTYNGLTYRGVLKVIKATGEADLTFRTNTNDDVNFYGVQDVIPLGTKMYLLGSFQSLNANTNYRSFALVNADGSLDTSFDYTYSSSFSGVMAAAYMGSDNLLRVFGSLNGYGGTSSPRIVKLNSNTTVDTVFSANSAPIISGTSLDGFYLSLDRLIVMGYNTASASTKTLCLSPQGNSCATTNFDSRLLNSNGLFSDGSILVAESHPTIDDLSIAKRITKLNTEDANFNANFDNLGIVDANYPLSYRTLNDKVYIIGEYIAIGPHTVSGVFRLNADGTPDTSFNAKAGIGITDGNGPVASSRIFSNFAKDIFVVHYGSTGVYYNTTSVPGRLGFIKLNETGELDSSYLNNASAGLVTQQITGIRFLPDNRALLFGIFTVNGQPRNLVRLEIDGRVDASFDAMTQIRDTDINDVEYDEDDNLTIYTYGNLIFKNKMVEDNYYYKFRAK